MIAMPVVFAAKPHFMKCGASAAEDSAT